MYACNRTPTAMIVDSQSLRPGDTVGADGQGRDRAKKAAGRKGHVAADCLGLLLVVATNSSVQDRDAGIPRLTRLRSLHRRITLVWDDGGYAGQLADWARKRTDHATRFVVQPNAHRRSHPDLA